MRSSGLTSLAFNAATCVQLESAFVVQGLFLRCTYVAMSASWHRVLIGYRAMYDCSLWCYKSPGENSMHGFFLCCAYFSVLASVLLCMQRVAFQWCSISSLRLLFGRAHVATTQRLSLCEKEGCSLMVYSHSPYYHCYCYYNLNTVVLP